MRAVSGKEFCRILEDHGWTQRRVAGSHHIYKKPGQPATLSVPVHGNRPLKEGTQISLMRASGLTDADL